MRNFLLAFCLIITLSFVAFAQEITDKTIESESVAVSQETYKVGKQNFDKDPITKTDFEKNKILSKPQTSNSDYNKNEFFVGYSYQNVGDLDVRNGFNGVNVSYVRNVSRFFGIKADVSSAFKNDEFNGQIPNGNDPPISVRVKSKNSVYNFLAGVQIKDNASKNRLKPFAHALVGVGHNRAKISNACNPQDEVCLAVVIPERTFSDTGFSGAFGGGLDIRINNKIDFRVIQVDYNPIYSDSRVDNNVRFGVGIVFK